MDMKRYIAFLRGVNISGRNKVTMAELKQGVERLGYEEVKTYLNSGNVIFSSDENDIGSISKRIVMMIKNQFDLEIPVFVIAKEELEDILRNAPDWWGNDDMLLGNHCGGCGNGNQSCKIAKCSLTHGEIEYCYECIQYPLEKYQNVDEYDSFITHRRQKADLERAQSIGIEQYNLEQQEKRQIFSHLLSSYNDGRRKNFFCVAVNLLELSELQEALKQIQANNGLPLLPFKAQCSYVAEVFQEIADRKNIKLKLIRKK